jgi:hypothetical protein
MIPFVTCLRPNRIIVLFANLFTKQELPQTMLFHIGRFIVNLNEPHTSERRDPRKLSGWYIEGKAQIRSIEAEAWSDLTGPTIVLVKDAGLSRLEIRVIRDPADLGVRVHHLVEWYMYS